MVRRLFAIVVFFVSFISIVSAQTVRIGDSDEMFISPELSEKQIYERQPLSIVVTLFSTSPDIAGAEVITPVGIDHGEFSTCRSVNNPGSPYVKEIHGKRYYCFPISAFVITMNEKGNYELEGGEYSIGVSVPVIVRDPFWGTHRSSEIKTYTIPVGQASFKVKSLPKVPAGVNFSGSIGEFTVETVIPRGDIIVNEEATAYVVVRGKGVIDESVMPEYRNAFQNGLRLKSVSENRTEGYDNGEVVSELHLECTFIPETCDNVEIGEVSLEYFNPKTGKYEVARSAPVKVNVKSSVVKRESIEI